MKRRVGSISLAGITGPEEMELLEAEVPPVSEVGHHFVYCFVMYEIVGCVMEEHAQYKPDVSFLKNCLYLAP